jgi:hypothetical protein
MEANLATPQGGRATGPADASVIRTSRRLIFRVPAVLDPEMEGYAWLPLHDSVRKALDGIAPLQPPSKPRPSDRKCNPIFVFARRLRRHPDLKDHSPEEVGEIVEDSLLDLGFSKKAPWDFAGLGPIDQNGELWPDPRELFQETWRRVELPGRYDRDPLQTAQRLANRFPGSCDNYPSARHRSYLNLVSICYWLQRLEAPRPILLSGPKAAKVAGIVASSWGWYKLQQAVEDGFLEVVQPGVRGGRRAGTYRFRRESIGPTWPEGLVLQREDLNRTGLPR